MILIEILIDLLQLAVALLPILVPLLSPFIRFLKWTTSERQEDDICQLIAAENSRLETTLVPERSAFSHEEYLKFRGTGGNEDMY